MFTETQRQYRDENVFRKVDRDLTKIISYLIWNKK